ncbi:MAG: hypothetical protein ACE15E_09220 [Acidobacteriota bacterium]
MRQGRTSVWAALTLALFLLFGCEGCSSVIKDKKKIQIPPAYEQARTATLDELVTLINERYAKVESIVASKFEVQFHGGSAELGFIEKYPRARGYLAAKWPSSIYVNILNPLTNSTLVAMASRNGVFQIWAPRDNKYLTGRTDIRLDEDQPLFNVRPQHLLNALIIEPVPAPGTLSVVFLEEDQDPSFKYYVVSVLGRASASARFCLERKIWIERSAMRLARQQYYDCGVPVSSVLYSAPVDEAGFFVSTGVDMSRVREHYRIDLNLDPEGLEVNRAVKEERFDIARPPGAELVVVQEKESH